MADELKQDVFALSGGLDLATGKLLVKSGSLLDCLNYDVSTVQGYSRIDGFERYDGHSTTAINDYMVLDGDPYSGVVDDFPVGALLVTGLASENIFGVVVGHDDNKIHYARINQDYEPKINNSVYVLGETNEYANVSVPVTGMIAYPSRTAINVRTEINEYSEELRTRVGEVPGTAVGLHWYRDRLYAVVDEGNGPDTAVLYEALTEQQAQDEKDDATLAGWNRIAPGWKVNYTNGVADSGEFTIITRGKENNFSFTADNEEGQTVEFINGIKIPTDTPTGGGFTGAKVSEGSAGWKATTDTEAYAQDGASIEEDDSEFLYADLQFGAAAIGNGGALKIKTPNVIEAPNTTTTIFPGITDLGTNSRAPLVFKNLSSIAELIPENSIVTGIELVLDYDTRTSYSGRIRTSFNPQTNMPIWLNGKAAFNAYLGDVLVSTNTFTPTGTKQTATVQIETDASEYDYSEDIPSDGMTPFRADALRENITTLIGGNGNTFGAGGISKEELTDPNKALVLFVSGFEGAEYPEGDLIAFSGSIYESVNSLIRTLLNRVQIRLYYTEPSARYYITDGTGVVTADLVYYTVTDGELTSGDAEGEFQFVNIQTVSGGKTTIDDADTVHVSSPTSSSNQVAVIDGDALINGLPNLDQINAESSRYQFVTANFYANADWDGYYGANGAGRGFSFAKYDADNDGIDENYLLMISTNLFEPEQDKPRHVAYYNNHLVFGLKNGAIRISVVNEPESFSGEDYATQYFGGGPITGLKIMKGTMLCVGAENSISALTGQIADNFAIQTFNPTLGILEYTMEDMGGEIVFCTSKGITTLSQTERYGDFMGNRLSDPVSPWLIPRLRRNKDLFSIAQGDGVVCAIPLRSKNQYRLFFKSGKILTMTYRGESIPPEFTFQMYLFGQIAAGEFEKFVVPLAWSAQTDQYGVDRVHISHYSALSDAEVPYVLELDRGWGFDGRYIPHSMTINWYHTDSPLYYKTLSKFRVDGLSNGISRQVVDASTDYEENWDQIKVIMNMPRNSDRYSYDLRPVTEIKDFSKYGRQFAIRFKEYYNVQNTIFDPEPSHVNQVLVVWYKGGMLDG